MTTSTVGRSSPRAATSVHSNKEGPAAVEGCDIKAARVAVRDAGGICPCREYKEWVLGRRVGKI